MSNLKKLLDDFHMMIKSMDPMTIQFSPEFIKDFDELKDADKLRFSVHIADNINSKEIMGKDVFREKQGMKILMSRISKETKKYIRHNVKNIEYPINID